MAKNYTEEEVEEAEKQAGLKERMAAAEAKMNPKPLTARELENREAERREAWHQSNMDARNRRLDAMEQIAIRDRGRYSPMTRQQIDLMRDKESNRRFDVENKTRLQESADKREGMIRQGETAAEAKAKGAVDAATAAAEAEKHKADQQRAGAEYLGRLEHGYTDADGVYHPGSAERVQGSKNKGELDKTKQQGANDLAVTGKQGDNALRVEQERTKATQAKAESDRIAATLSNETKLEHARIAAGGKITAEKMRSTTNVVKSAITAGALNGDDPATTIAKLREQYKDSPEDLAAIDIVEKELGASSGTAKWGAGKK